MILTAAQVEAFEQASLRLCDLVRQAADRLRTANPGMSDIDTCKLALHEVTGGRDVIELARVGNVALQIKADIVRGGML